MDLFYDLFMTVLKRKSFGVNTLSVEGQKWLRFYERYS